MPKYTVTDCKGREVGTFYASSPTGAEVIARKVVARARFHMCAGNYPFLVAALEASKSNEGDQANEKDTPHVPFKNSDARKLSASTRMRKLVREIRDIRRADGNRRSSILL